MTVLVSSNGRVITALGLFVCGHAQRLMARSYPGKVELIFEDPDHSCKEDPDDATYSPLIPASTRLPEPLGNRALLRVRQTKGTLPYFSERDQASVRRLPFGLRLSRDEPSDFTGRRGQPEIGDTRTFMSPTALLEVNQIVPSPAMTAHTYWFNRTCPNLDGWNPRHGFGHCRSVYWVAHGYHFLMGMAVERGMTLSVQEVRAIAEGIRLSPGQYWQGPLDPS